jgi:hypothetical protein
VVLTVNAVAGGYRLYIRDPRFGEICSFFETDPDVLIATAVEMLDDNV